MTTRMTRLMALMALMSLTACDYAEKRDLRQERESARYQAAMADYKAGRIDQAIAGFRKTCQEDPANASARFQLACLLQDSGRDYLGALCSYQEFLMQHPESDKAPLAKDRAAICEREAAKVLAEKHGLTNYAEINREKEMLAKRLKDVEKRNAKLDDDVSVAMQRVAHLLDENAKLKAAIRGDAGEAGAVAAAGVKDAKALLDEDDGDRLQIPEEALKLKREREEPDTDRVKMSADVASLRQESDADANLPGSSLLPARGTNVPQKVVRPSEPKQQEPPHEKRPAEYVVQDGDTLYKIAVRFYGKSSSWKLIRNANKAVISTDGRVMKGMKIKLPDPK